MKTKLSFDQIAELEPRVRALEALTRRAAPAAGGDPDYMVFLREVKPLVVALVGWERGRLDTRVTVAPPTAIEVVTLFDALDAVISPAKRPDNPVEDILCSSEAYDVVYEHLVAVIGGD